MVNCMVKTCKNRGKVPGITYHQIPRYCAKEWLNVLNRKSNEIISHRNVVCSQHFKDEDFKGGKHTYLKHGAVPSINLGESSDNLDTVFIHSNDESVNHDDTSFLDLSEIQESTSQKDKDPLEDENLQKEEALNEYSDNEKSEDSIVIQKEIIEEIHNYDEDLEKEQVIESSDSEKSESREIQKKIIEEFHDYSLTSARYSKLAVRHAVNSIKKKLKAAQQKHRRLERRVIRLKDMLEKLKQKNV